MLQGLYHITTYASILSAIWSSYGLRIMEVKFQEETKNVILFFFFPCHKKTVNFHKKQEVGNGESVGGWESVGKSGSNLLSCLWDDVMR